MENKHPGLDSVINNFSLLAGNGVVSCLVVGLGYQHPFTLVTNCIFKTELHRYACQCFSFMMRNFCLNCFPYRLCQQWTQYQAANQLFFNYLLKIFVNPVVMRNKARVHTYDIKSFSYIKITILNHMLTLSHSYNFLPLPLKQPYPLPDSLQSQSHT